IQCPDAHNINLGFTRYRMPESGQLFVYSTDGQQVIRAFTQADNEQHGQLWTPVLLTDDLTVEVTISAAQRDELELELTTIGHGYKGFGTDPSALSGSCNIDVVCSQGDPWLNEIKSVAVFSTGGSLFCTGFMVNNTAQDGTPFFMTADHCNIGVGNAASLVTYWNYETSVCGGTPDGVLSDFNTGSIFRADYAPSDFTLVELDDDPDPAFDVTFAGWDRTLADPPAAIGIHHPSVDEKRISFEDHQTFTTSWFNTAVPGDGTHLRVVDWDLGTTEGGSSGSPLFNPDHRVVGQLHGGDASCVMDSDSDWYGRFSRSWTGGGNSSSRLSDWLDPISTGQTTLDTLELGMSVVPSMSAVHAGSVGGPFTPTSVVYTLTNITLSSLNYNVSLTNFIGLLLNGGTAPVTGTLAGGATVDVTVSVGSAVNCLAAGDYSETVVFDDLTNVISFNVVHSVEVGRFLYLSSDTPIPIPDATNPPPVPGAPIVSSIVVPDNFSISDVDVSVNITHTYKGDLTVELESPLGVIVRLHNETGSFTANVIETYDDDGVGILPDGPGSLSDFELTMSGGTWLLRVQDNAPADTGTLNSWVLSILQVPTATCVGDINIDTSVNVTDLLALLAAWGPNPGHAADINCDDNVNVTDLLALLAAWGACP
ncbi:MAG: proprotein convertase P-domain-containing protein, partial [Planctomycetes bacterium]|nr:proprotein convertase P-domain-containing protein [Planctomycetota bacterium]